MSVVPSVTSKSDGMDYARSPVDMNYFGSDRISFLWKKAAGDPGCPLEEGQGRPGTRMMSGV